MLTNPTADIRQGLCQPPTEIQLTTSQENTVPSQNEVDLLANTNDSSGIARPAIVSTETDEKTFDTIPASQAGDGSLIDRPDVIRAVATVLVLINLVSLIGFWRLHNREKDETLQGPLRFITDVNSAPASELSLLPGIGYELANRIVEYRETMGPYQAIEDLNRVRGIGPKTLAQIEPMVVFGPAPNQLITPPEPDPLVSASPAASRQDF
jgi:competence ComEA-like helix-hairpin-helix protein